MRVEDAEVLDSGGNRARVTDEVDEVLRSLEEGLRHAVSGFADALELSLIHI